MKKILIIAILLLTLLPAFNIGSDIAVHAQNYAYENGSYWLDDLVVTGKDKSEQVKCDCCNQKFDDDEAFQRHLKYNTVCASYYKKDDDKCSVCGQPFDQCKCDTKNGNCCFCGQPLDQCTCPGVTVTGSSGSGSGGDPSNDIPIIITRSDPIDDGDDDLKNTDTIIIDLGNKTIPTDTLTYHHCQCLITSNTRSRQNAIDNNPKIKELEDLHYRFSESLKRHIAFPETIQQGNEGTCAAATIQKYLAENLPDDYIDCAISLAETGEYKKWSLKIPDDVYIGAINESILNNANKGHNDYIQKDIDYTSVDYFIQAAIQNWYNDKRREKGYKVSSYNPCLADGDGSDDGMRFCYVEKFLNENIYNKFASPLSVAYCETTIISYSQLKNLTTQYDPELYSYVASVAIKQDSNGAYSFTTSEKANHLLEIRGANNGYIDSWTWGQNGTTSTRECYLQKLMILPKTEVGIQEKKVKEQLSCNCKCCANNGCDSCSYSLTFN